MKLKISYNDRVNQSFTAAVFTIYMLGYLSLGLLPAVKYSVPYIVAGLFTMLPLILASFKNSYYCKILILLVLCGVVQGILSYVTGNGAFSEIANEPIRSIRYFVPCVLLAGTMSMGVKTRKFLWLITTALVLYVAVITLKAVDEEPMIARLLANGSLDEELMEYRRKNIGGFGNCYAICIVFSLCIYLSFYTKGIRRLLSLAASAFILYFAVKVQYMTMMLLCICAIVIAFVHYSKSVLMKYASIFAGVFVLFLLPDILRWLAASGAESQIYSKLVYVAEVLEGTRMLGDATSRAGLYRDAFSDFIYSPIWGTPNSIAAARSHSSFLGYAAGTGIIGLGAYIYSIKQCCSSTLFSLKSHGADTGVFVVSFIIFLILAMVNPIHYVYEISILLFFYVPLTLMLFSGQTIGDNSKAALSTTK